MDKLSKIEQIAAMALQGILAGEGVRYETSKDRASNIRKALAYAIELLDYCEPRRPPSTDKEF